MIITEKFSNGGLIIKKKNSADFIKKEFKRKGIILFRNLFKNYKDVSKFVNVFTAKYSNDAYRRENIPGEKNIKSVDLGKHEIPLHSESSFTSTWPEIIWFYCLDVSESKKGKTTICDGIKLWNQLSIETKTFFLSNPFCFELEIEIAKKKAPSKHWYFEEIGFGKSDINFVKGRINTNFSKFLVHRDRFTNKICFANHLFSCLKKDESQIKKFYPLSKKKLPDNIIREVKEKSEKLTYEHDWKKFDLIMINNKRFLHGRRKIDNLSKRQIVNLQSLEINI